GFVAEQVVKNYFEPRHNEHEEETHDSHRHRHDNDRINHRRDHLVLNLRCFFLKLGKPGKHQFKDASNLARFDHIDVQIVKDLWMQRQCVGKSAAALH